MNLPTFTPDTPYLFFELMEAALRQQGITDPERIFLSTLTQCPQIVQVQAKCLLTSDASVSNKLQQLKTIVENLFVLPCQERLKTVLATSTLGDMKPSEYLRHIRTLQGTESDPNGPLIRKHFVQNLPDNIAPFIHLMLDSHDLDSIAKAADRSMGFYDSKPSSHSIINTVTNVSRPDLQMQTLTDQLNDLKFSQSNTNLKFQRFERELKCTRMEFDLKFEALHSQMCLFSQQLSALEQSSYMNSPRNSLRMPCDAKAPNGRSITPQNIRPPQRPDDRSSQSGPLCWYHSTYGEEARNCIDPCSYVPVQELR